MQKKNKTLQVGKGFTPYESNCKPKQYHQNESNCPKLPHCNRSVQQSGSNQPHQLRGRSDRWSKGWMGLAGRLRAARPLRAARKTRPLHREQERGRGREKGQEMRTQSNPERQSYVKKQKQNTNLYLSPLGKTGPLPREKLSRILLGKAAQDRYTKVIWPRLLHVMLPASITSSYFKTTHSGAARTSFFPFLKKKWASCCLSTKNKKKKKHFLARQNLLWLMTSWFST